MPTYPVELEKFYRLINYAQTEIASISLSKATNSHHDVDELATTVILWNALPGTFLNFYIKNIFQIYQKVLFSC